MAMVLLPATLLADAVVTFNEVNYNPTLSQDAEWVELHNQMAVNVDISGWKLADGIEFTFGNGTVIPAGAYLIIAKNPANAALSGVAGVLGPFTGSLSNSGETIQLLSRSGRLMDRVAYGDSGEWPVAAHGVGATLAKRLPGTDSEKSASWTASLRPGGTPATGNFPPPGAPIKHVFANSNSTWRYHDSTTAPAANWNSTAFNDTAWPTGLAPFGTASSTPVLTVTSNLVERYRAGAITGIANGSTFSSWPDTATGDGVSQNTAPAGNPTYRTNATPTLQPAVRFDGNDDFRTTLSPGIAPSSGFAYFVVCKANSAPADTHYIFDRDISNGTDQPLVSLMSSNNRFALQKRNDDGNDLGGPISTTQISTTQFQIVAVRRNTTAARFEIWVDGVMEGTTPDAGDSLTPPPIVIGNHASFSGYGFDGDIAELLVYKNALSDTAFQSVGAYLEARYGLATAFPDTAVRTTLSATAPTSYFRKSFTFAGDPARTQIRLDQTVADGAIFYLNGQQISRTNLPAGQVGHTTTALSNVTQPVSSGFLSVPSSALVSGNNVLSASLHKAAGDNIVFLTARLEATETPAPPTEAQTLKLSEIAATAAPTFFIELVNSSPTAVSTVGYSIGISGGASFSLPASTVPAGGLLSFSSAQLGWSPAAGDKIVLLAPDASIADVQVAAITTGGRSNAYPGQWLRPSSPTPGSANEFILTSDIVINEICYKAPDLPSGPSPEQWIELYNKGTSAVDLSAWKFAAGIDYTFASGTTLAPGASLVVARDPALIPPAAGLTVFGPWSGSLSGKGERILLQDASGNPADEVSYLDGGRWTDTPDGAGSTLELRDPRADNSLPESWAASDETSRRAWQTYTYQGVAAPSTVGPDGQWNEFIFGLLDSGEVLLDDITVTQNGSTAMITGGNFESGTAAWHFLGNHSDARIVTDPANASNHALYLRATGATEHMHNHVETTFPGGLSVTNGNTYQISFKARWISGCNKLNTRLYFNRLARTTELPRTEILGTPGLANSAATANCGPGFTHLNHSPAVPEPGESVTITARASDPDGLGALTLFYSPAGAAFVSVPMTATGDGATFTAQIPGYSAAAVVRFYVAASDAATVPVTSWFPAAGASSRALYQVNDSLAATNGLNNIRIIMTPDDKALLYQTNNLMSNARIGCTVIYRESEIYYNAGVRLKSSQRGRPESARVGFNLSFNDDQLFRGIHGTIAIDRSEGQITGAQEILYDQMMYASGGIPAEFNDLCKVIAPDPAHTSTAILQLARYGSEFLDTQFDNGTDGTVYEYELIYYPFTADANGYKQPQPDGVTGTGVTSLGPDKENYRWTYLTKNSEDKDDYSKIIAMTQQFDKSGAAFDAKVNDVLDVDQWLRALAYSCATGAGDSFFQNSGHNGQFYARPSDGRMLYFPHDQDFAYDVSMGIFTNTELQKLTVDPARKRAYLGHLHDVCTTVFNQSYMATWASHFGSLLPNEDFPGHLSYINTRSNYILSSIHTEIASLPFAITTNNGANFTTNDTPVALAGEGWINVRNIRLAGSTTPLNITWTSTTAWSTVVPIGVGANVVNLEAVDFSGQVVGTDSITITNTGSTQLPGSGNLVVSKIYYSPLGQGGDSEYIELQNISAATIDLSGLTFTAGIVFTFPNDTLLLPGARTVVIKNQIAFQNQFGTGVAFGGVFTSGSLNNGGETLTLRRADNTLVRSFAYSNILPWPTIADTADHALVLIDPASNPDHADPLNWRASAAVGGAPGTSDTLDYASWKTTYGNPADNLDTDGDGLTTLVEYYVGGNPLVPDQNLAPTFTLEAGNTLLLSITRRADVGGVNLIPESSTTLGQWQPATGVVFVSNVRLAGTPALERLTFRIPNPNGSIRFFARFAIR